MKTRKPNLIAYFVGALMLVALPVTAQEKAPADAKVAKPAVEKKAAKVEKKAVKKVEATRVATPARAVTAGGLQVVEAKAAGGVTEREAVGEASSFAPGDEVTVWAAIRNTDSAKDIKMVWFANNKEVSSLDIEVGKSWRWRTWMKSKVWAGDWKVEIQDGSGTVLETVEFSVKAT